MKEIEGYEGMYLVTEDGKVWNHRTKKWLSPLISGQCRNYSRVILCGKNLGIHRLVAQAFIPNNYPIVCHKVESYMRDLNQTTCYLVCIPVIIYT